ncbi:MAG: helix-turn-helix domain-containing protein [Streptosporangiales bacterium]|nr:helix-turn-helix domain-containing protein [Streptosporangiales bacterium]
MSQTVQRAVAIVELVSDRPRTLAELATALGVHKSTALRLAETLIDTGLVRKGGDHRYLTGYRLAGLAARARDQFDLQAVVRPHLERLQGRVGDHTIHFAAIDSTCVVYVDKVESHGHLRLYSQIGRPVRLHASALGKVVLAYRSPEQCDELLAGYEFERSTDTTITDRAAFDACLHTVRERGWATDDGEFEPMVNCLAAPVWNHEEVVGGVSITALKSHAALDDLQAQLPALQTTARDISKELGHV